MNKNKLANDIPRTHLSITYYIVKTKGQKHDITNTCKHIEIYIRQSERDSFVYITIVESYLSLYIYIYIQQQQQQQQKDYHS